MFHFLQVSEIVTMGQTEEAAPLDLDEETITPMMVDERQTLEELFLSLQIEGISDELELDGQCLQSG